MLVAPMGGVSLFLADVVVILDIDCTLGVDSDNSIDDVLHDLGLEVEGTLDIDAADPVVSIFGLILHGTDDPIQQAF